MTIFPDPAQYKEVYFPILRDKIKHSSLYKSNYTTKNFQFKGFAVLLPNFVLPSHCIHF